MSNDNINPFQAPVQSTSTEQSFGEHASEETVLLLQQTRPWTLTVGILMIIVAVFMVLGSVGIIVAAFFGGNPAMIGASALYLFLAAMYVIPALLLIKYSRQASDYIASPDVARLNLALRTQKSFWKFCGIAALLIIVLYVVIFVGMMVFLGFSM